MNRKFYVVLNLTAILLLATFFFFTSETAKSSDTDYNSIINEFFNKMDKGEFSAGIDFIYSNNPWMVRISQDDIQKLKNQFSDLPELAGKYLGHEHLFTEEMTSQFVIVNHIVYMERQPFRFCFIFYKTGDVWKTNYFGYSDDMDEWLKEVAKSKYFWSEG